MGANSRPGGRLWALLAPNSASQGALGRDSARLGVVLRGRGARHTGEAPESCAELLATALGQTCPAGLQALPYQLEMTPAKVTPVKLA